MVATGGSYLRPEHLIKLNRLLISAAGGAVPRLIVSMPPRHGKSELVSKYFPAWYLGKNPDKRIILSSYEQRFASSWGEKARQVLHNNGKRIFNVSIKGGNSAARGFWQIADRSGVMYCAGVGSGITGHGGDCIVIDDPVKNAEEANSEIYREKAWEWFKSTLYTRIEPNGCCILVMTRWHEDDLAGRLIREMESGGEHWDVIDFPAIASGDDELGRSAGDVLWHARFPEDRLEQIKQTVGTYWWNALYQQRPVTEGGGIFKREYFKYFTVDPNDYEYVILFDGEERKRFHVGSCTWFQMCDTALKTGKDNDYTAISTILVTPDGDMLIYDMFNERLEVPDQYPAIKQQKAKYPQVIFQAVEDKGSGIGIIQIARRDGNPLKPISAFGSKKNRASGLQGIKPRPGIGDEIRDRDPLQVALPASVAYENGMIYHRSSAPWLVDFEDQLMSFDKGTHDDMVDVTVYAWQITQKLPKKSARPPRLIDRKSDSDSWENMWKETSKPVSGGHHGGLDGINVPRPDM